LAERGPCNEHRFSFINVRRLSDVVSDGLPGGEAEQHAEMG
jgi:hypothetical protein